MKDKARVVVSDDGRKYRVRIEEKRRKKKFFSKDYYTMYRYILEVFSDTFCTNVYKSQWSTNKKGIEYIGSKQLDSMEKRNAKEYLTK